MTQILKSNVICKRIAEFVAATFLCFSNALFASPQVPDSLIAELGCAGCHANLPATHLTAQIPDLSFAGLRYQPAYLFEYLQNPQKIRKHIGNSRMPDFHLQPDEALALTLFLSEQQFVPQSAGEIPETLQKWENPAVEIPEIDQKIRSEYACLSCHSFNGAGEQISVDLATIGYRLKPEFVQQYLASPAVFGIAAAVMPPQFFAPENAFEPRYPDAATRDQNLTAFLMATGKEQRSKMEQVFAAAKEKFPAATAAIGEAIFRSQQCVGCHNHSQISAANRQLAPDLTGLGDRVQPEWLKEYLKKSHAIRPFGYQPGSGSRMPDFRLTDAEAETIAAYLLTVKSSRRLPEIPFEITPLSGFSMNKTTQLLNEKLPCIGCHTIGETGGKIGPNLNSVNLRLTPDYLWAIISDPQAVLPHNHMPKIPMPESWRENIFKFLHQQSNAATTTEATYLSLVNHPVTLPGENKNTAELYAQMCGICHGETGDGNGYNARYLPVSPTAHSDSAYMSTRQDAALYDGIAAGGFVMNRSHAMPPFLETLTKAQIADLVKYMRKLCNCEAPSWSRDGSR